MVAHQTSNLGVQGSSPWQDELPFFLVLIICFDILYKKYLICTLIVKQKLQLQLLL